MIQTELAALFMPFNYNLDQCLIVCQVSNDQKHKIKSEVCLILLYSNFQINTDIDLTKIFCYPWRPFDHDTLVN